MHNPDTKQRGNAAPYVMFGVSVPAGLELHAAGSSPYNGKTLTFVYQTDYGQERYLFVRGRDWSSAVIAAVSQYRELRNMASGRHH